MSDPVIPLRTPMYDAQGNLTRAWILYFESLGATVASTADDGNVTYNGVDVTY